jgi:putative SOS response-associated peptidase YedK
MCGRFTLRAPASVVAAQFGLFEVAPFAPRFNIAPSQTIAVVRVPGDQGRSSRELAWLRWGLIPSWADDPAIGSRMINARSETAADKPAFRAALRRRRCLVVADGFYEWKKEGKARQPYFIHFRDDRPFGFAGLWEVWEGANHAAIESCTLLTTEANGVLRPIHDRMPVIVAPGDYALWLDPAMQDPKRVVPLLRPYPEAEIEAYPVNRLVNSPANDDPKCVQRA